MAGVLALTSGVFTAGLATTAGTAFAATSFPPVVTQAYTITPSTAQVQNVSAAVNPTTPGQTGNYVLGLTTPVALAATSTISVTVMPPTNGTPTWEGVTNVAIADLTAGNGYDAHSVSFAGNGTATLSISVGYAGINAGDSLEVTFQATNPTVSGSYAYDVSTSASPTPAETGSVTIGIPAPSVSAGTLEIGAFTTYTLSNLTSTAALTATAGSTPTAPNGNDELVLNAPGVTFAGVPGDYTVTNETTSPATVVPVTAAALGTNDSSMVTLTLGAPGMSVGNDYTVTADGTNPSTATTVTFTSTSTSTSEDPTTSPTQTVGSLSFGLAVANIVVTPSPTTGGSTATYTVTFGSTDGVPAGGSISITGPKGTVFNNESAVLTDTTTGMTAIVTGSGAGSNSLSLPVPFSIAKGDAVNVMLFDVTNPPAGSYSGASGFTVTTTGDPLPSYNVAPVVITSPTVSNLVAPIVTVTPNTPGSVATYTIATFKAEDALVAGTDTIEVSAPSGTVLPGAGYTLTDSTTASGTQALSVKSLANSDSDVVLNLSSNVAAGDVLSLSIANVVNPPTGSTTYTISMGADSVLTNATAAGTQGLANQAVTFPGAALSYPNGGIVSFSGTDYVFAGGMAFPAGTELAAVQKVDPATVVTAPSGTTPPTVSTPAVGTMIKAVTSATIYVVGTNGQLYGFASPSQMESLGYDPAFNVTVPSLGSLVVASTTAGASNVTALDTSSSGAIVNSSGTFYVFAGGKAFGIPTPASLANVMKSDKASVEKGTITSAQTSAKIANGTLITVPQATGSPIVWVTFAQQLYSFVSQAELKADGFGGTASLTAPNAGGLSIVPRPYATS